MKPPMKHSAVMELARRGMTLIEIMAVVVILGLLAATLTFGFAGKMSKAKREIAKTQIGQIVGQVQLFQLEKHKLPTSGEGLAALTASPAESYYLEPAKLNDPWGNAYIYLLPGPDGNPFEVVSYGADGRSGGANEDADISSAQLGAPSGR